MGYCTGTRREKAAFLSSGAYLVGMLASTAFGLYPEVLPATPGGRSLTVTNAAAAQYGLSVGLIWWTIGIGLAAVYFVLTYRLFRGKVAAPSGPGHESPKR